jgi:hypothetical protein
LKTYNSKQFRYEACTTTFYAEASDLGRNPFDRIYSDACDEGFSIESAKTGKVGVFYLSHTKIDRDNDIVYWELKPTAETIQRIPRLHGIKVIVFND